MRCRAAYSHIDELNPEGQKDHIGGKFLAMLHKWSNVQPTRGLDYWLTYFTDFYKNSGGLLTPVKIGAVKRGNAQLLRTKKEEVDNFNKMMDDLVKKYMITSPDQEKDMNKAVNF